VSCFAPVKFFHCRESNVLRNPPDFWHPAQACGPSGDSRLAHASASEHATDGDTTAVESSAGALNPDQSRQRQLFPSENYVT